MQNPKQSKTLHIEMLGEELSVYDWKRQQMHSLNSTAAKVFALCDGNNSPAQMAIRLAMPEAAIWQALDELSKANLLQAPAAAPSDMSRRSFLKLGGAVAAAAIVSIMLPSPAAAQSGGGVPIMRIAPNVGTVPADNNFYFFPFTTHITDADIAEYEAASGPINQYTVAWDSGDPIPLSDAFIYLSQASGGPRAQQYLDLNGGQTSPATDSYAGRWTGNRPYGGIEIAKSSNNGSGPWTVGNMTITLEHI